jgi:tetratricopeptide (TPR) repeat protein
MRGTSLVLAVFLAMLAATTAAVAVVITSRADSSAEQMRTEMGMNVERGGIGDLGRAQALGRRLFVARPNDREALALLAFVNAVLAVDYGLSTSREAEAVLARISKITGHGDDEQSVDVASTVAAAAAALVLLHAGDRVAAIRRATAAASAGPGTPHPLYALGRARALGGELQGAARALEATIVGTPGFSAARVAWAEVRLDLGDATAARSTLMAVLAGAPADLRAHLLLDEAEQALGIAGTTTLQSACGGSTDEPAVEARWPPAHIQAACTLARAGRARRLGARAEGRSHAQAAAVIVPDEPRLLAHVATVLAQVGAVDGAMPLLERARRLVAPQTPSYAWAAAAVALGAGRAASLPAGARPADPEARLLVARAALAGGGLGELTQSLDALGGPAIAFDSDLRQLARLRAPTTPLTSIDAATASDDPLRAYVDGLLAQFQGDLPRAAERFWHALSDHGDACRAMGEYVATLRTLKLAADPAAWKELRRENVGCVNLP